MIEAFQYIQNIGRFEQMEGRDGTRLAPLTLVYSENGRGKTTLCAILRSLATGSPDSILERRRLSATSEPRAVVEVDGSTVSFDGSKWSAGGPRIVILDDHFVDANVHSGLSVGPDHRKGVHELVVGEEGVRFQKRVEELTAKITALQSELRQKERAIPSTALGDLSVDDFCALTPIENLDGEIEDAERSLSVVRDAEAIRGTAEFRPFALPPLDLGACEALLDATLADLEAAAVDAVQRHLAALGTGGERWAAEGLGYLGAGESCPFCGQDITGSTLEPWDAEAAAVTELDRLYRMVSSYVENADGDPQKVTPALRVLLRGFARRVLCFLSHRARTAGAPASRPDASGHATRSAP